MTRPDTRTPGERLRVAVHESGHAIVALGLGRRVDMVSIRPGDHFGGICVITPEPDTVEPGVAWRRRVEQEIMTYLAGPQAEVFQVLPSTEGYDPTTSDELAARLLAEDGVRVPLSQTQTDELAEIERLSAPSSDAEAARDWARRLTPCAEQFLNWLRAETRRVVRSEPFQRRLGALAPALLAEEVLSGRTVRELIRRADRRLSVSVAASR